ncbi:MAG: hypothetical protein ACFFEF_06000 [Candidatus Thorarchaeota archaeon]
MSSESSTSKKVVGLVVAASIFIGWVIIDFYAFPIIGAQLSYPLFELLAYGSWFIVLLLVLGVLSITDSIPTRKRNE